jgi:hypothetical protein
VNAILKTLVFSAAAFLTFSGNAEDEALEYFKLRNDVASAILSGNEETVEKAIKKASGFYTKIRIETKKCSTCKGAKPFIVSEPDYKQNIGRIKKSEKLGQHKVVCPVCKMNGFIKAYKPTNKMTKDLSAALRTFEAKSLAEGMIKTNGAFLSSIQIEKATPLQMQAISLYMGEPCKRCNMTGISQCRKCKGEGTIKCRTSRCDEGWIKFQRKSTQKTKYPPTFKPCPQCRGTETTPCAECLGSRATICKDCNGEGFTQKKR